MSHVGDYNAVIARQTDELIEWLEKNPQKRVGLPRGPNTDLRAYLDEYSYKWGMTEVIAGDIGYPEHDRFIDELEPYSDLEDLMG